MGAKLFAWIGGFALFLAVAYFVKYSFEHELIPPEVRVALGYLVGIGLVAGGMIVRRKEYSITAHTLCATGILILYAVTFACRAVYHFAFFGPVPTFVLMTLVTATAFLLAVRLQAQVVALLGMLGGFLTPMLLSTGQDAPMGLFGYIALLNAGLLAVARHQRWFYLTALAGRWHYDHGNRLGGEVLRTRAILPRQQSADPDDDPPSVQRTLAGVHKAGAKPQGRRLVHQQLHGCALDCGICICVLLRQL